jgi:hypothetical protein
VPTRSNAISSTIISGNAHRAPRPVGHQHRCQRRADTEQRIQHQHRAVGTVREEALNQSIQCHHRRTESEAQCASGDAQQDERARRADQKRTGRQQRHGDQIAAQAHQQHAAQTEAPRQT